MPYDPEKHHRRSIRLQGYDYSQPGAYFVTICVRNRECLLGDMVDGAMVLNDYGKIVESEWLKTAVVRPNVELDEFIVMPNHFHGIIFIIDDGRGTARRAPTGEQFGKPSVGSLPTIVRSFKSAATNGINQLQESWGSLFWQRGYHEHIIRSEGELDRIRKYIIENPIRWDQDENNPNR